MTESPVVVHSALLPLKIAKATETNNDVITLSQINDC